MKLRSSLVVLSLSLTPWVAAAQIRIHNSSAVIASGVISTNTTITNASPNADLSDVELKLMNTGDQLVNTSTPIIVKTLHIDQGGVKTFSGNWEIVGSLFLP